MRGLQEYVASGALQATAAPDNAGCEKLSIFWSSSWLRCIGLGAAFGVNDTNHAGGAGTVEVEARADR